jgi:DNA recombination protein RmuC
MMEMLLSALALFVGLVVGYLLSMMKGRSTSEQLAIMQSKNFDLAKQIEANLTSLNELRTKNEELSYSKGEFQGKIIPLENQIKNLQIEKQSVLAEIASLRDNINQMTAENSELSAQKESITRQYDSLKAENESMLNDSRMKMNSLEKERKEIFELNSKLTAELAALTASSDKLERERGEQVTEIQQLKKEKDELSRQSNIQAATVSRLEEERKNLGAQLKEFNETLAKMRETSKIEFELAATKILEGNTKEFSEKSQARLGELLNPLKEKLISFEKQVEEKYRSESVERGTLKNEIERLVKLNEQVTTEANALTQALKGDSKFQGNWGEIQLEKILESAGLVEGEEFDYVRESYHKDQDGNEYRPDAVVNLPDKKHIVIDSKVSLTAFANYHDAASEVERQKYLKDHINSIKSHIKVLAEKNYGSLVGVSSPEFVLMFVPLEHAYITAIREDLTLLELAWKNKIAVVTSSTLFTTLKTVASIWKFEKQNKYSEEIAAEAGALYDKFVGFLEDFEKIDSGIASLQKNYDTAMNKLKDGSGNVFRRFEKLKVLGVSPKKAIPSNFID